MLFISRTFIPNRPSQIVEVFRRKPEGGREHIVLQVIDGSSAGYWQHNR